MGKSVADAAAGGTQVRVEVRHEAPYAAEAAALKGALDALPGKPVVGLMLGVGSALDVVVVDASRIRNTAVLARFRVAAYRVPLRELSCHAALNAVLINGVWWADANLDVRRFNDGAPIPEVRSTEDWYIATDTRRPMWCHYDNDKASCAKYGKLYFIHDIAQLERLCPSGWTIPTYAQWCTLMEAYGIFFDQADHRINREDMGLMLGMWKDLNAGAFKPVLGGMRNMGESTFLGAGKVGVWAVRDNTAGIEDKGVRTVGLDITSIDRGEVIAVDPRSVRGAFSVRLVKTRV